MKTTYKAVVETGSTSMPGAGRVNADGTQEAYYEERITCGHAHRTYEAAVQCLASKRKADKYGNCSALWYNGRIHDQDGCRA